MTDRFDLSRRKMLGAMGTIGGAAALGGAGTMAFFSDEENFANNQLVAGELDLKVDWEEHYSDWMGSEADEAEMADPDDADYVLPAFDLTGFENTGGASGQIGPLADGIDMVPLDGREIALSFTNSQDAFWDATSIEAFPDEGNDGIQAAPPDFDICDYDADLDGVLSDPLRTNGTVEGQTTNPGDPLINLDDVKPGDFGEVTLSFHLCGNPGYVWLTGDLVDADENGNTEPEANDEDEYGPGEGPQDDLFASEGDEDPEPDGSTDQERVELLDYILTRIWYDDGNNQVDQITGQLDLVIATDISGSLSSAELSDLEEGANDFINALEDSAADIQVGTIQFGDTVEIGNELNDPDSVGVSLPGADSSRNTPLPPALDIADQLVNDTTAGARSGAEKAIVVFTDGGPNYENIQYSPTGYSYVAPRDDSAAWSADAGDDFYDNATGGGSVTEGEMEESVLVADSVKTGGTSIATVYVGDAGEETQAMTAGAVGTYTDLPTFLASSGPIASSATDAFDVDLDDLGDLSDQLVDLITTAEDVFFLGTLRDALDFLSGQGHPLDGDIPAEDGGGTGRNCFSNSNDHYIGFEWWLPINHGNQVQGDSVSFDIGFYTEQCRHNDGSGMANS
ncbi:vWA domain-containing protein [Salinigranum sp. GCM10025319]|uniref:vWA domain-containing protein n=1 Tax=Salinigranum sp. GCM10025319 TaxID=3252687 RepID=UPI00360A00FB